MRIMILLVLIFSLIADDSFADAQKDHQAKAEAAIEILARSLEINDLNEKMQVLSDEVVIKDGREEHSISLYQKQVGTTEILFSAPLGYASTGKKYSLLFISAGFFSGKDAIKLIPDAENKILVGYQYPTTKEKIEKDPSLFPKTLRVVPGQIALTLEWLLANPSVDHEKFHVMGVSLGSLFLPVSLHLAQERNVIPTSTLLCFGGADLNLVIDQALQKSHPIFRDLAKALLGALTAVHDPRLHLPYLKGSFFTVYATEDGIFPRETSLLQYDLLPEPKEIHWVQGPHIDENQPGVIYQTMLLVREFLKKF